MEAILRETWTTDVLPLLADRSATARVQRAGLFAVVGVIVGAIVDLACLILFRRRFGLGRILGGAAGAMIGAFSPEIMDWAAAYESLDSDYVDDCIRENADVIDLEELLSEFGLVPSASLKEFKRAYKRRAFELHPDRNDSTDAHPQMVALNAAKDRLLAAYKCGELPLAA